MMREKARLWYGRHMVEQAGALPSDAETSLADSRAQFVTSLGRRLEQLRLALAALEQAPRSAAHRDHLKRRIHAFGAAAGVLGFDRVFEAFREAEGVLGRASASLAVAPVDLAIVARTIDLVPSLVMGTDVPLGRSRSLLPGALERRGPAWPTSVLVFGPAALVDSLNAPATALGSPAVECERTEDPERAEEIVRVMAPDVAVVDADRKGSRELMETLVYDPLLDPVRIIAIGSFDRPEAAASLVALGVARVLPKPVSPDTLKRSVLEVARERAPGAFQADPLGDLTIEALGDRISQEIHRGLVEAVKSQSRGFTVSLGDGTDVLAAVWASVARIRELVTLRSGGAVRFDATGPEGAIPLVPWMGEERQRAAGGGEHRAADGVELAGRTVVVADDDPAVAWFLSGILKASGADVVEAHDGARALELVRERWPDLVVSDILMPGLDGFALCREIKRDIALSDVPVILLSWKEDLLQRVRELGAAADGYLRKEATASVVVQRVREVLLPRARVESRIASGAEARGRLDGITPRLVLEIVEKRRANARVSIRDAAFLYEVDVRDGRVRTVSRTASDGRTERGERVLAALLGVRAGRFAVRPDETPCAHDWTGSLRELLAMPIERARAAQRALAELGDVARVEFDGGALEPYMAATPQSARDVVRRLAEGASPDDLAAAGVPSRLVESVLADVVLHGGVRKVLGRDGEDRFARELSNARERRIPSRAPAPAPAEAGMPIAIPAAPVPVVEPAEPVSAPDFGAALPPGAAVSDAADDPDSAFASLLIDSIAPPAPEAPAPNLTPRPFAMKGMAPPTSAPPEPSPLETALRSLPAPLAQRAKLGDSPAPAPAAPAETAETAEAAPDRGAGIEKEPQAETRRERRIIPRPARRVPSAESSGVDLGEAVMSVLGDAAPSPNPAPVAPAGDAPSATAPEVPAKAAIDAEAARTEVRVVAEAARAPSAPGPVATALGRADASTAAPEAVLADSKGVIAPSAAPPAAEEATMTGTSAAGSWARAPGASQAPPEKPAGAAIASVSAPSPESEPVDSGPPKSTAKASKPSAPRGATDTSHRRVPEAKATPSSPSTKSSTGSGPTSARASEAPRGGGPGGTFGVVVVVAGAAVASFAIVNAIRGATSQDDAARPDPARSAAMEGPVTSSVAAAPSAPAVAVAASPPAVALAASAPAPVAPSPEPSGSSAGALSVADLELPQGVTVPNDRGLLEVEVGTPESIYVDGVFIGRGPSRRIALRPGRHEVRLRGDDSERTASVDITTGRRARVGTTNVK
jgi:CheY-like chemotaxis protein